TSKEAALQYSIEAVKNMDMMGLKIEFIKPILVVPSNIESRDKVVASLDSLEIHNQLKPIQKTSENFMEEYQISMKKMNLHSFINDKDSIVWDDTDLNLSVKRAIINPEKEIPDLLLHLSISDVRFRLSQPQYQFIFK